MKDSTIIRRLTAAILAAAAALMLTATAFSAGSPAAGVRDARAGAPPSKHRPLTHRPRVYAPPRRNPTAEDEDERGELAADTFSTDYMLYRGGPLPTSPRLFV